MSFSKYKLDFFLVFLLIGISTIPFLKKTSFALLLIMIVLFYLRSKIKYTSQFVFFILIIILLEIFHFILLPRYEVSVVRDQVLYFIISGLTVFYLKDKFLYIYIKIIYFFTCLSFVFFLGYYISKDLLVTFSKVFAPYFLTIEHSAFYEYERISPVFYNFDGNLLHLGRNNGPFWEPTVFATMLIIAQIFNLIINKNLFNKKGIIFSLGLFSTFSTTGYVTYSIFIFIYLIFSKRINKVMKMIFISLTTLLSILFFSNLTFLESKINNEISSVSEDISERGGDSRIASALLDWYEIKDDNLTLIFGKGSSKFYRVKVKDSDIVVMRNCGDTALIVQWGIPFFILYFALILYSFKKICLKYNLSNVIYPYLFSFFFLILGFSEVFFELPFFHCFLFLGFAIDTTQKNKLIYEKSIFTSAYI